MKHETRSMKHEARSMKKRIMLLASCFMLLSALSANAQTLALSDAIAKAVANNPSIKAAHEETLAAKARVPQAVTPENPELGIKFDKTPINTLNVEDSMSIDYGIKQTIPFPSKLISAGKAAKRSARAAGFIERQTILNISSEVKKAFFGLLFIEKRIKIEEENYNLFKRYKAIAETKYATGLSPFDDPIKASLEASEFENRLSVLKQERAELTADLEYLMGSPLGMDTALADAPKSKLGQNLDELKDIALKSQPELGAAGAAKDAAASKLSLARQQYLPDIMTELEYNQQKNQQNAWTASFGISLPLWFIGKQQPAIREARAMRNASSRLYENAQNKLRSDIISVYEKIRSSGRIIDVYERSILPKARAALKSAEASYSANKADFLNLLESARSWRDFQIDYWQARSDYESAIAEMETLTGGKI